MDMPVVDEVDLSAERIGELIRWHGTDENDLPPPHTLQNLARDTVAALRQLQHYRAHAQQLRGALGRAFWSSDSRELHRIVLAALGPPPVPPIIASSAADPQRAR